MDTNAKSAPVGKPFLQKYLSGKPRKEEWNYLTSIGMLTYLQGKSCPDIPMAVHKTVWFSNNPMISHEKAIKQLGWYLHHNKKEGIVYNPDTSNGLECYIYA